MVALKLNIRWQLALVSVALSLVPIVVVGVLAYQIARGALEERIRLNLETLAVQSDEKLERLLLDHHQNLAVWSQIGFIRDDAVTGDADGRIQQFLQEAKRNTDVAQELWVANAAGTVIASTLPTLRGREVGDREFLQAARRGETWVGTPMMQDLTGRVGMPLAFPLQASFDRSKPVGVLVAVLDWPKIQSALQAVRVLPEGQDERGYLVLANSQGVLLAAPPFLSGWEPGRTRLNALGLDSVGTIVNAPAGSGELEVRDSTYLAGYATTEKRPYLPDAWRTILLMRTDVAFEPLGDLLWTIIVLSIVLGTLAAAGSLYWATQFSRPIMSLVPFLKSVAGGDLSQGISIARRDELGMLADAANDMANQLRKLLQDLQQASIQITGASTQVLTTAEEHASGSVQQAASIAQVTATMEELTNTAKQIAMSATSVEKIADDSAQAAHAGTTRLAKRSRQWRRFAVVWRTSRERRCCSANDRSASLKCSTSSRTSRVRFTCWPSTPQSNRPPRASTAGGSPWSPAKCAAWRSALASRQKRSRASSVRFNRRRTRPCLRQNRA